MIIISDGDPAPPSPQLMKAFHDREITVSTVSIFPHGGMETDSLRGIANVTGGRYYNTNDPDQLPSIFIKEAKSLKRAMVQTKTFTPEVGFPSPILKGIGGLPPLRGYVLTTPKERLSEEILRAHTTEDDQLDPVLVAVEIRLGNDGRLYVRSFDELGCRLGRLGELPALREAVDARHLPRAGRGTFADVVLHDGLARSDRRGRFSSAKYVSRNAGPHLGTARPLGNGAIAADCSTPVSSHRCHSGAAAAIKCWRWANRATARPAHRAASSFPTRPSIFASARIRSCWKRSPTKRAGPFSKKRRPSKRSTRPIANRSKARGRSSTGFSSLSHSCCRSVAHSRRIQIDRHSIATLFGLGKSKGGFDGDDGDAVAT